VNSREKLAAFARGHAGCSSVLQVAMYVEGCIRLVDRVPRTHSFYFNNSKLSTCAIFVCECHAACGSEEPEFVSTYLPLTGGVRDAMVDIENVAYRFKAWVVPSKTMAPLRMGDVWIVDNAAGDAHTGICVSDAVVQPDGSWVVETVEGGQVPVDASGHAVGGQGSSAVLAFTGAQARRLVWNGAHWMMGARYLYGCTNADKMPVPDDVVEEVHGAAGATPDDT
jgi:hypothetical protein